MLRDRYSARAMVFILLSTIIIILNSAILHAQTANNGNQEPIKIMLTLWPPSFLAYIAQEKGIFEKNGVNVQLLFYKDYFKAAVTTFGSK